MRRSRSGRKGLGALRPDDAAHAALADCYNQLGTSLVLTASRDIQYKDVVAAMDAVRMDGDRFLFPDVLLAATNDQAAGAAPAPPATTP